ncbi:unnamed protein product [Urochloa decumbens]|uniref:DUF3615 domain-containing protein n=1 Tax=Urochloa decumbens TaxID=240449 RepID=A0ABC8Y1G3_9POAL
MITDVRRKRRAEAGDRPDQPKTRRGTAAAAASPVVLEVPTSSAPCVHTGEKKVFDVVHTLRNREVRVLNTDKPAPKQYRKGEKPVLDISWHTPACAKAALKHYNRLNEDQYELVKAVDSIAFFYNGQWMHANFLAKSKGGTSCADLVPKSFFAELKVVPDGKKTMSCASCIRLDPDNPRTAPVRGCRICPSRIFHPAAGGCIGASTQGASRKAA